MEQGIADTPMQHEGINSKRYERKAFNQQVKTYRKSKAGYKNMQEKVINRGHLDSLSKHFSFNEKKVVKELSHELKTGKVKLISEGGIEWIKNHIKKRGRPRQQ